MVRVLCERGCDVNLPVSAGYPGPGLKHTTAFSFLPSDHWPPAGRMPTLTPPCTVPSRRAQVPAASWRSSPKFRPSMSLPQTARGSPCCTTRPSRATRCEFGVCTTSGQAPGAAGPLWGHCRPRACLPTPTELSGGFSLGHDSWWMPRRRMASRLCTWPPSTTTGRWPRFSSERCGHRALAQPGASGVRAHLGFLG